MALKVYLLRDVKAGIRLIYFSVLIFGTVGLNSAFADPSFDVATQVQVADFRLELALNPPAAIRSGVEAQLDRLKQNWSRASTACLNPNAGPTSLHATKRYLQGLLEKIAAGSHLENRLKTDFGVCIQPELNSEGMFSFLSNSPRLEDGIIRFPIGFMSKAKSEDELVFVIAHELSHYLLNDEVLADYAAGSGRTSGPNGTAFFEALQTQFEHEADELALKLTINAGYNPREAVLLTASARDAHDRLHYNRDQIFSLLDIELDGLRIDPSSMSSRSPRSIPAEVLREIHPNS